MQNLTPVGNSIVNDLATRYQLSYDAVLHMLIAVNNGAGSMAQFNCPELGGSGQWMRGGMTMVGDMFNHGLKMTVDNLCNELSAALANNQMFPVIPAGTPGSEQWWPSELGQPFSSGAQNQTRYAIFPHRLATERQGQVTLYDTLDHQIGGVSQQQGGNENLSFSSQYGNFDVSSLPLVTHTQTQSSDNSTTPVAQPTSAPDATNQDIIDLLSQLGRLKDAGVLTQDEFESKKRELMARI